MNLKKIFTDYKNNLGTVWLWLGIVLILFDVIFIAGGPASNQWTFIYGINYAIGFLAVAIVLGSDKPKVLSGVFSMLMGLLVVWYEASGGAAMDINVVAAINIMAFLGILAVEKGFLNFGPKTAAPYARYTTVLSFAAWFLWPLMYFWQRITTGLPLTINTDLYHGGIMLLAGLDLFTFAGTIKFKWYKNMRLILLFVAILGAYLVAGVAGWGLRLV